MDLSKCPIRSYRLPIGAEAPGPVLVAFSGPKGGDTSRFGFLFCPQTLTHDEKRARPLVDLFWDANHHSKHSARKAETLDDYKHAVRGCQVKTITRGLDLEKGTYNHHSSAGGARMMSVPFSRS